MAQSMKASIFRIGSSEPTWLVGLRLEEERYLRRPLVPLDFREVRDASLQLVALRVPGQAWDNKTSVEGPCQASEPWALGGPPLLNDESRRSHELQAKPRGKPKWVWGAWERALKLHQSRKDLTGERIVSEILHNRRALNKAHIEKLSERFHVSPAVFF